MNSQTKYIIVSALKDETQDLEQYAPVIHTGIGKINACIHLYQAIEKYQPQLVINYGTAGSLNDLKGLHKIDNFIQSDMDVRGLDIPRGITPFSEESLPDSEGITLATSDSFITNPSKQLEGLNANIDLVDMEAYALRAVCQHHSVKFLSYKYVSDNANDDSGNDWKESVSSGTDLFKKELDANYGISSLIQA